MLKSLGDWAFVVASFGTLAMTLLFLVVVRWWTDVLGRVILAVLVSISAIVGVATAYYLGVPIPDLMLTRFVLYAAFGVAIWVAVGTLIWAQFVAPRVKQRRNNEIS